MTHGRLGMGLVGAGFVGPHHVDAVRRLGLVDVVAVAGSNADTGAAAAQRLNISRSYGSYEALIDDAEVDVVHVATPNHLHFEVTSAALARGKHVVSEKPLAMNASEAGELLTLARHSGVVHAVMFNYRGNPLVQEARARIGSGEIGPLHLLQGRYLQDWLLEETDFSWRLEPSKGGSSSALADIGSHWCDLAEHVSGLRIVQVLGEITTVRKRRKKPSASRDAFQTRHPASAEPSVAGAAHDESAEWVDITVEDLASVLMRFDNGAAGALSIGQVCAGHKNDLVLELCGSTGSMAWRQERQNELWIGRRHTANELLQKDPSLMTPDTGSLARLPGGHQEGWADAFFNVIQDIYRFIAGDRAYRGRAPFFATFDDGVRAAQIVDAIIASAKAGGVWTTV